MSVAQAMFILGHLEKWRQEDDINPSSNAQLMFSLPRSEPSTAMDFQTPRAWADSQQREFCCFLEIAAYRGESSPPSYILRLLKNHRTSPPSDGLLVRPTNDDMWHSWQLGAAGR